MKVLVTGVAGRIGRNLADALIANGAVVRGAVLPDDPGLERTKQSGIECYEGNLRDHEFCEQIVTGVDAVAHLGGMLYFNPLVDDVALVEDNYRGTFNLLHACATTNKSLKRFVFASSDEVYPSLSAKYLPIDEEHPTDPYSFYGVTKRNGEDLVRFYHRAHGVPGVIARFALTLEPWEALVPGRPLGGFIHLESALGLVRMRAGDVAADELAAKVIPDAKQLLLPRDESGQPWIFHCCDVRDLVSGLLLMLEKPAAIGEAFNLSGPGPFSFAELIPYVAEKTGRPVVEAKLPGEPIRIHHSIAKARGILGYKPVHDVFDTIETGLAGPPS